MIAFAAALLVISAPTASSTPASVPHTLTPSISPTGPLSALDLGHMMVMAATNPGDQFGRPLDKYSGREVRAEFPLRHLTNDYEKTSRTLSLSYQLTGSFDLAEKISQLPSVTMQNEYGAKVNVHVTSTVRFEITPKNPHPDDYVTWKGVVPGDEARSLTQSIFIRVVGKLAAPVINVLGPAVIHQPTFEEPEKSSIILVQADVQIEHIEVYDARSGRILTTKAY